MAQDRLKYRDTALECVGSPSQIRQLHDWLDEMARTASGRELLESLFQSPHHIPILFDAGLRDTDALGAVNWENQTVTLHPDIHPNAGLATLFHELVHVRQHRHGLVQDFKHHPVDRLHLHLLMEADALACEIRFVHEYLALPVPKYAIEDAANAEHLQNYQQVHRITRDSGAAMAVTFIGFYTDAFLRRSYERNILGSLQKMAQDSVLKHAFAVPGFAAERIDMANMLANIQKMGGNYLSHIQDFNLSHPTFGGVSQWGRNVLGKIADIRRQLCPENPPSEWHAPQWQGKKHRFVWEKEGRRLESTGKRHRIIKNSNNALTQIFNPLVSAETPRPEKPHVPPDPV